MFKLLFYQSKALQGDRKKLMKDKKTLGLAQEALGRLAINPFSSTLNIKKLVSPAEATFRLRCGKWRILFDVDTANKNIIVYRIKPRKEGY